MNSRLDPRGITQAVRGLMSRLFGLSSDGTTSNGPNYAFKIANNASVFIQNLAGTTLASISAIGTSAAKFAILSGGNVMASLTHASGAGELILNNGAKPANPTSGSIAHYYDSTNLFANALQSNGVNQVLTDIGLRGNMLSNGGFDFAQRQVPATLTTYSNTSGRTYGPDRWGITNENASAQFARIDATGSPPSGLHSRYYGQLKKITSTGKVVISQVLEANDVAAYRGRTMRFQMLARNNVGSATLRMVLLQLTAAGTVDTIPGTFISAFGASGTDPTWGTNLTAIVPTLANTNSSISGSGLSCVLTASFLKFGGTFAIPADCKNLIAVIFTNGQPVTNDIFEVAEVGLYDGDEERQWLPVPYAEAFAQCQRFYSKTFSVDQAPTNAGATTGEYRFCSPVTASTAFGQVMWNFPVPMFKAPTVTGLNPVTGASAHVRNFSQATDCTATTTAVNGNVGVTVTATTPASTVTGVSILGIHFTADAEL